MKYSYGQDHTHAVGPYTYNIYMADILDVTFYNFAEKPLKVAQHVFHCAQSTMTSCFCSLIVTSTDLNDGRFKPYEPGKHIFSRYH